MKLIDILLKVNESNIIQVFDASTFEQFSYYDGRDAIDPTYNEREVAFLNVSGGALEIYVK